MLRYMERSTIYYLKQKGWTNVQIAEFTGHHRDTIARVLREDVEKKPKTRNRSSAVVVFDAQIREWLDKNVPVTRMLELARADGDHPYTGSRVSTFPNTLFIAALQIPPLPTHSALRGLQFVLFSHHARTARPRSQHRAGAS